MPSFFNLAIELLIEGLPGSEYCIDYKFHEERGYKQLYHTHVRVVVFFEKMSIFFEFYAFNCYFTHTFYV